MAKKLMVNTRCPYCLEYVEQIPDHKLKKNPHEDNVEFVITKSGYKQYFHTTCWFRMVRESKIKHA